MLLRRLRTAIAAALCVASALVLLSVPAGAQQLVDAGKEATGRVASPSCSWP